MKIKYTKNENFEIHGEWFGNQSEVIETLEKAHPNKKIKLWGEFGKEASDNTFEGTFACE